jgi:hypothetical protein
MYYEDQARRFNLLSGLLAGVALGAGIGLLAASSLPAISLPVPGRRKPTLRERADSLQSEARRTVVARARRGAQRLRG